MNISLLQIILIISTILLLYIIFNAWINKRLRLFHAFVFIGFLCIILTTTLKPDLLAQLGRIVGVEKGSDFLVYISIIFLGFVFFSLLQNLISQQQEITRLCSGLALREYKLFFSKEIQVLPGESEKDKYIFLIRAYNEATVIKSVIDEIIRSGFRKIVIVNDGSNDTTENIINTTIKEYKNRAIIIGIHHPINRGPGAANKTLFSFASMYAHELGCEWCVTYDADGQMSIEDMKTFMKYADNSKYDVIIGSRFVKGASTQNMPLIRRTLLIGARIITYIFNGLWITDVPTGYRMYSVNSLLKIQLVSDRFSYQNDIIDSINRHHLRFIEIPVHIRYTEYSLKKGQSNMSAVKILIRLIYSSLFSK